jgi:hypothetical protein
MHEGLISRTALVARLQVRPGTIAKWTRLGWFPERAAWISERVILVVREPNVLGVAETRTRNEDFDYGGWALGGW